MNPLNHELSSTSEDAQIQRIAFDLDQCGTMLLGTFNEYVKLGCKPKLNLDDLIAKKQMENKIIKLIQKL